ncbi:MAG: potassium transporter TrkG [Nocardioidaceae bacterium]|nr:potassium transporter TrkG [Nocardioidaceae bacterium]
MRAVAHPVRLLPLLFFAGIVIGSALLMLPISRTDHGSPVLMPALFTSTSAVTVTGLASVDTATFWTPFGQGVILVLMEVGGFGITTIATVLGMAVGGRLGMRTRMLAQAEMRLVDPGGLRQLLRRVAVMMLAFQAVIAVVLTIAYRGYYDSWATSLWHGLFHSVGAFNNAGFSLESDSLVGFAGNVWIIGTISLGVFVGALGFPVMAELWTGWRRPSRWTIHTRLTVWGSVGLLVLSVVLFLLSEWNNAATIGGTGLVEKLVTGIEGGVMPRSGGFNSFSWGEVRPETLGVATVMMFIGGGSASTAGGIKITTFLLLAFVILAEVRGDDDVTIGNRRIGSSTLRQALCIALLSVMLVAVSTLLLLTMTSYELDAVLFEATSAFATVGLSTGITPVLPYDAQGVLMVLMFVGRVGTVAAASALALRSTPRRYRLPEERPIIG